MAFDGWDVELFGYGVEEVYCWAVDAWEEGVAGARVTVCPVGGGAVDAVGVRHGEEEEEGRMMMLVVRGERSEVVR